MFDLAAIFLTITALLAWCNKRFIGLPATIGVMVIALALSLGVLALDALGVPGLHAAFAGLLRSIDFSDVLMQGMLSMLLFAGALHVDLGALRAYRWQVGLLAVGATTLSTLAIAYAAHALLPALGVTLPLAYCLLFGALISPTDPIAVMGMLKSARADAGVSTVLAGESLFNDGVGVVLFALFLSLSAHDTPPGAGQAALLLLREAGGGCLYGGALGFVTYRLLRAIDSYQEEVLVTLAAVLGGYVLASHLHVSGPLAMVVAGLIVGNHGRAHGMSHTTREHVDTFWELLDAMLNAVLFVLIGLEMAVITIPPALLLASVAAILIVLAARALTVLLPIGLAGKRAGLARGAATVLTWGGLRGGISVALALSLPAGQAREIVVRLTYAVVIFSVLVQGLSMRAVVARAMR